MPTYRLSARRACRIFGISRRLVWYRSVRPDDASRRRRLHEPAEVRLAFGAKRLHTVLCGGTGSRSITRRRIACIGSLPARCGCERPGDPDPPMARRSNPDSTDADPRLSCAVPLGSVNPVGSKYCLVETRGLMERGGTCMWRTMIGLFGILNIAACAEDLGVDPALVPAEAQSKAAAGGIKTVGRVVRLDGPPGTIESGAIAVNDAGYVVGWSRDVQYGCAHIILWDPRGKPTDLGRCGIANDMNNRGEVVGTIESEPTPPYGYAFLWSPVGGFLNLSSLGASSAVGISDLSWVVGTMSVTGGIGSSGYVYSPGNGMQSLTLLAGMQINGAYSVNSGGDVVVSGAAPFDSYVWSATAGLRIIPPLAAGSASSSSGWKINEQGWVAGAGRSANGTSHGFLWIPGSPPIDIGVLWNDPVNEYSIAWGLSENGVVVGSSITSINPGQSYAITWTAKRGLRALPHIGNPQCVAMDVNGRGRIAAGWCRLPNSDIPQAVKWVLP